ncbi:hypothetical protein MNBD_GAMMA10-90 [hydrothermal vent metagenome]|uniref:Uncharacterized protein n=1 Tax=hydrothermal vent metagenome TaxID=652676 RepID=A0A3B0YJJ6_9ZZZZ
MLNGPNEGPNETPTTENPFISTYQYTYTFIVTMGVSLSFPARYSQAKDWAVFACKDDTLYRVPKAHNRTTTPF